MKILIGRGLQMIGTIILFGIGDILNIGLWSIPLFVVGGISVGNLAARAAIADEEGL